MAKNEVIGVATCHVCKARGREGRARIKRNVNGRLYSHCENTDCRTEIRYEPDGAYLPKDVPGYIGPFQTAPIRNVTEPEKPVTKSEPVAPAAPVVATEQKGGGDGIGWW